jgi:hypothetical protein
MIELRRAITERMDDGASLGDVDATLIESQPQLDEDEKAALWLLAWSTVPLVDGGRGAP